tara:strand:- start:115 stop:225 length:111 start_codon:yes stop_codon:yes gene_type:complete
MAEYELIIKSLDEDDDIIFINGQAYMKLENLEEDED